MMRNILFRGKRIDNGEWIEGALLPIDYIATSLLCDAFSEPNMPLIVRASKVRSNTICEYTGLTDKNGNKIWENDILRVSDDLDPDRGRGRVTYYNGMWYVDDEVNTSLCDAKLCYTIQRLGNIFDKPELLKSEVVE